MQKKLTFHHLIRCFCLLITANLVSSCQTMPPAEQTNNTMAAQAIEDSQNDSNSITPPISSQELLNTLMPPIEITEPAYVEDRFDVLVKEIDARNFLLGLVKSTPFNMVVSPDVDVKISLQLTDVTVSEVLDAVEKIYPLMVEKQGNLYFVSSAETMTAIYPVDYLNLKRSGKSRVNVVGQTVATGQNGGSNQSGGNSSSSGGQSTVSQLSATEINTETEVDFWQELKNSLELIVRGEEKANVITSPQSGLVIVKALPKTQRLIREYLGITQSNLNRHVILEAKIVEVILNDGFKSGIDWQKMNVVNGNDTLLIGQQGQVVNTPDNPLSGMLSMLYNSTSFRGAIELLKTQGNVQVLSSPRISTINNQKAVIKVGSDEFFVTDVSTTTVTGTSTSTTPDVTLTPFFSGISLDVTPQINQMGEIILHIHPVVSEVNDQQKTFTLGQDQFSLPLALTNVRESDSIIRAKDQQVVVIGGLMQNRIATSENSTPVLGDVPLVGHLFRQAHDSIVKSELVILLKANIVNDKLYQEELSNLKGRFNQM